MEIKREVIEAFYKQFFEENLKAVYTERTPKDMMESPVDDEGWYTWRPIKGTLTESDYHMVEQKFGVSFPKSFINWHKSYYFLKADCVLVRLPGSSPLEPLQEIIECLDNDTAEELINLKLYPFGQEGSEAGPLVFDGRHEMVDSEYPIRFYNYDYGGEIEGLSEIVFSSFLKLLECVTYFLKEVKTRKSYEVIPDFLSIDPKGAGKTGIDYWLGWAAMEKENDEYFGE